MFVVRGQLDSHADHALALEVLDEEDNVYPVTSDQELAEAIQRNVELSGASKTIQIRVVESGKNKMERLNSTASKGKRANSVPNSPKQKVQMNASQEQVPTLSTLMPLMQQFFSDENIQQALRKAAPLAATSLQGGSAISSVVSNVLMLEPAIANHPLVVRILPYLPSYYVKIAKMTSKVCDFLKQLPVILPLIPKLLELVSSFSDGDSFADLNTLSSLSPDTSQLFQSLSSMFSSLNVNESENADKYIVSEPVTHVGYSCESCKLNPILGSRYYCEICDISLCEPCELAEKHPANHSLTKIRQSKRPNVYLSDDLVALEVAERETKPLNRGTLHSSCVVADANFPRESVLSKGQTCVKTWIFCNDGPGTWPEGTRIVEIRGYKMTNTREVFPVRRLEPLETGEVSVVFDVPHVPGTYTSYFSLIANGRHFGEIAELDIIVLDDGETSADADLQAIRALVERDDEEYACRLQRNPSISIPRDLSSSSTDAAEDMPIERYPSAVSLQPVTMDAEPVLAVVGSQLLSNQVVSNTMEMQ